MKRSLLLLVTVALAAPVVLRAESRPEWKFDFGPGAVEPGYTKVTKASVYSPDAGFGFVDAAAVTDVDRKAPDALRGDFCEAEKPFTFAVNVPEGNYDVTVLFGDQTAAASATVKAEARRLMIEKVETAAGRSESRGFTVNVRTPSIVSGRRVSLDKREMGPPMAPNWDDRLTLEFLGSRVAIAAMSVTPAPKAITVFLAGDSTVTDQADEPWAGWGQVLPRFFQQGVAVANYAESGRALHSFRGDKRLEKILSMMRKGDYLFIQFGHNDQKDKSPGSGPFTSYKDNLRQFIGAAREKGGIPVLVTPMERRRWKGGMPQETLTDFAEAVRQAGAEEKAPVIDLHAMSLKFYEWMGAEASTRAFVHYPAGTFPGQDKALKDDTHHNVYGAYELAKCVVEGIKKSVPELAKHLRDDAVAFDPSKPDAPESVDVPASPLRATEKPAGN